MWQLLAQADVVGSYSGWAGAGLLGLVLGWLMLKHLPAKDAQLEKLVKDKDDQLSAILKFKEDQAAAAEARYEKRMDSLVGTFAREVQAAREEFKRALDAVVSHCEKESTKLVETLRQEMGRLSREGVKYRADRADKRAESEDGKGEGGRGP